MKTLRTALAVMGVFILALTISCGKNSSNPLSPGGGNPGGSGGGNGGGSGGSGSGGGSGGGGGTLPPPPPSPGTPTWTLPDGYHGRNPVIDPVNGIVYGSGVKPGAPGDNSFFVTKFPIVSGERSWLKDTTTPGVYNWVTKGIGSLNGEVYALRWEDPMGGGNAKIFSNKYNQNGLIESPPWPLIVGNHTAGMDLVTDPSTGSIFAATVNSITSLSPSGSIIWQNGFGFNTNQGIIAITAGDGRLFMTGMTNSSLFGQPKTGVLDAFVAEVNPANGQLIKGFVWVDRTYPLGDLHNKYTYGDAIGIAPDGIVVAARTGLDFTAATSQKSKIVKFSFAMDGVEEWMFSTENEKKVYGFLASGGDVFALSSSLWRISPSGTRIWTAGISAGEGGGIALDSETNTLYVMNDSERIYRVNASSGTIIAN